MGILAQRFADDEVRDRAAWLNDEDGDGGSRTPSGVRVTARAALGLTTVWRCVDLLSSAVAQSPKDVIVKVGGQSFPEYRNKPGWLTTPNPLDPTYTANDYFAQVALSLLFDGNYFVHVFPYVFDPQVLTVLAPDRVKVKPARVRAVRRPRPGHPDRGSDGDAPRQWPARPARCADQPFETLRRGIGSAIAAEDFGGRFFGQRRACRSASSALRAHRAGQD